MASPSLWTPSRHHISNETVVHDAQLTNYLAASAIAILLWVPFHEYATPPPINDGHRADYFATVQEEIDFVWKRRWSVPSILYVLMFREIESDNVFGFKISPRSSDADEFNYSCRSFIVAEGLVSTLLVVTVWVLCGKGRRVGYILFAMLLAELITMLIILLLPATYLKDFVHLGAVLPGCYFTSQSHESSSPLVKTFSVKTFLIKDPSCADRFRDLSKLLRADKTNPMPLVTLFLRDGIIWFIGVFGIDGAQMLIWATGRATLTQVLIMHPLSCVILARVLRVLLNTKSLGYADVGEKEEAETQQLLSADRLESRPARTIDFR
ncbi:hypothetical protein DFH06DRAFT_1325268 [Mycena polygramma]|nr:hypothetical protein DFH06DRAFT_1325268 [Mycena polygramma]